MRIFVGVDGSPGGRSALEWALAEGRSRSWPVTALLAYGFYGRPNEVQAAASGFGPEELEKAAHDVLAKAVIDAQASMAGLDFQERVSPEEPVKALLDAAHADDLLVVGARGLGPMRRFLLGSVGTHCVRHAHSPIVVVRWQPVAGSRVVVGVDGSDESIGALRWAAEHARARGLVLDVVSVWSAASGPSADFAEILSAPAGRDRALADLERLVADQLPADGLANVRVRVVDGQAAPALIEAAEGADGDGHDMAELLVVGSRGQGGFARLTLGSTSSACSLHARCSVAVIPGAARAAAES